MSSNANNQWMDLLRKVSFGEGCSYLLFAITMPLKYMYDIKEPNKIIGMAHGILFVAYIILVLVVAKKYNWKLSKIAWAFLASIIPFGTFYANKKLF
ncbi:MAG: DUF3817 domain-containing protein [Bacteroidia bacterium]|nr:DUF3817 domain-containing protein [Bacteroidia bacterium]